MSVEYFIVHLQVSSWRIICATEVGIELGFTSDKFVSETAKSLYTNITRKLETISLGENIFQNVYYTLITEVTIGAILLLGFLLVIYLTYKHKR